MDFEKDILGKALLEQLDNPEELSLQLLVDGEEDDDMPLPLFFRDYSEMNPLEQKALNMCKGDVLDVGAGAGSHSLYLQQAGFSVDAIDISEGAVEVMQKRGVQNVKEIDLFKVEKKYDSILLLMNGLGMGRDLEGSTRLLKKLSTLLKPGGQIIGDSSDIFHLYTGEDGDATIPLDREYYGEVEFQMIFNKRKGEKFNWIYLSPQTLDHLCSEVGLKFQEIENGLNGHFLCRIIKD